MLQLPLVTLAGVSLAAAVPRADTRTMLDAWAGIRGSAIAEHVRVLASDEFEGRAPGTRGEELSLDYLRTAFERAGLKPPTVAGYAQPVPLVECTIHDGARFTVTVGRKQIEPRPGAEFVARLGRPTADVDIAASELVFAGFGAVAAEYDWDDYGDLDLHGKTVVLLRGDPGTATGDSTLFGGIAATRHSMSDVKVLEAARRGARAAIVIHTDASTGFPWSLIAGGGMGRSQYFLERESAQAELDAAIQVPEAFARELFAASGHDLDAEMKAAAVRGFRAHAIGVTATMRFSADVKPIISHNMIGVIPGREAPDESVVLLAHWDHMGRSTAVEGDQIFNGAVDNATGVGAMIEIARAFQRLGEPPRRTLVFVATTAEERGLLGSEYLARHPVLPLAKVAAAIAIDALFPYGAYDHMTVTGFGNSELDTVLADAASRLGRTLQDDGSPQVGAFYRADQYPFVRRGVPGFQAVGTPDNARSPETDPQMKAVVEFGTKHYHKPTDKYDAATWDMAGIEGDARVLFEFAWRVATDVRRPNWHWNSPFRAIGDALRHGE